MGYGIFSDGYFQNLAHAGFSNVANPNFNHSATYIFYLSRLSLACDEVKQTKDGSLLRCCSHYMLDIFETTRILYDVLF